LVRQTPAFPAILPQPQTADYVSRTKPFRHQNVNLLSQKLLPLVPKSHPTWAIHQHGPTFPDHHDQCVWSGFQKPTELCRVFALGDLTNKVVSSCGRLGGLQKRGDLLKEAVTEFRRAFPDPY